MLHIFNSIYSVVQNETIIANVSSYLSYREINNVNIVERLHYFSSQKADAFIEANNLERPIEKKISIKGSLGCDSRLKAEVGAGKEISYGINLHSNVKKAIAVAKRKEIIVPYKKSRRGKYVLIHFPFYNGTMMLKTCKKYDDVYWWCGEYRDLKVFACGNKKNRIDDSGENVEPLWNPSAGGSSKEFFDMINSYVSGQGDEYIDYDQEAFFEKISSNLHEGTMRGCKEKPYQGWYVMLLRCDCVRRAQGRTEIFGSPVFVSYETLPGYGWYHVCDDDNKEYYVEHCRDKMCHFLTMIEPKGVRLFDKFNIRNKGYVGYNYGYQMFEGTNCNILRIMRLVSLVSRKEGKRIMNNMIYEEVISKIKGLKAVGLTTKVLYKNFLGKL